ncbi:MAG: helix-turn-helix transcriptional regulator [Luteolibacter sp.]
MFLSAFHDLIKPQWLAALTELKLSGGMAVSELSRSLGSSYMTVKQHCEDLTKLGYLKRTRVPRTEIGRPEIFYRLSDKADGLFPAIPASFTIEMLEQVQRMFGENAPDRMLFQYFQEQGESWKASVSKGTTLLHKAQLFAKIRSKEGLFMKCLHEQDEKEITLREYHHPLKEVLANYSRAEAMELRAMEDALGVKIARKPQLLPGDQQGHVDFVFS